MVIDKKVPKKDGKIGDNENEIENGQSLHSRVLLVSLDHHDSQVLSVDAHKY